LNAQLGRALPEWLPDLGSKLGSKLFLALDPEDCSRTGCAVARMADTWRGSTVLSSFIATPTVKDFLGS
jgi:hypothetical protein